MRHHRVRFTASRIRNPPQAVRRLGSEWWYMNNQSGRAAKQSHLFDQRQKQSGICPLCGQPLALSEARFKGKVFKDGLDNPVIHKSGTDCARCEKGIEKSLATKAG